MIHEKKLRADIMRRVITVYWLKLIGLPILEVVVLLGFLMAAKTLVFWQAVLLNMAHVSADAWVGFALNAFWHTRILVKVVLLGLAITALYVSSRVRDNVSLVIKTTQRVF